MRLATAAPILAAGAAALALAASAPAAEEHGVMPHDVPAPRAPRSVPEVRAPVAGVSATPSCAFDASGRLWATWVEGRHVVVSSSPDGGASWKLAVAVDAEAAEIDANGEARPKIAIGGKDEVLVTYTEKLAAPYSGQVLVSRSVDGGRTFSPPLVLHDDRAVTAHRFDTLVAGPGARVTVAWLDRRDHDRAVARGATYAGTALYAAVSLDGGATFLPNVKVADHVCECCRVAGTRDAEGNVSLLFRAILGGRTRDHALVRLDAAGAPGPVRRVSWDGWEIDGCPHHGPAIAAGSDGTLHLAWYTGEGKDGRGLFYARTRDGGATVEPAVRLSPAGVPASHPAVLAVGRNVFLAWLAREGGVTRLLVRRSADGGATWDEPRETARTTGTADHPLLLAGPGGAFVSWFDDEAGLSVTPLEPRP